MTVKKLIITITLIFALSAMQVKAETAEEWYLRGNCLMTQLLYTQAETGYEEAMEYFDRAIELNPEYIEAWYAKADLLAFQGRLEEALECTDKMLEINPNISQVWTGKGLCLTMQGKYEEAYECFDKAVEISPENIKSWNYRGWVLCEQGKYEEGISSFDKAIEIKKDDYYAWFYKALYLSECKHYKEAIECLNKALEIKPDDMGFWYQRGMVEIKLEQYEEAITSFNEAIKIAPELMEIRVNKGFALYKLGDYEKAEKTLDRVLETNAGDGSAWFYKGLILAACQKYNETLDCYDKALELKVKSQEWLTEEIKLLQKKGNIEEAFKLQDELSNLNMEMAEIYYNKGFSFYELKDYENAVKAFDKAIEHNPSYKKAIEKKEEAEKLLNS